MAIQPTLAGYTGTLSGTPVAINPQADKGFVSEWLVVIPTGSDTITVAIGADSIPVPSGIVLTIPGPIVQFTLNAAAGGYIVYCGTGTAPMYAVVGSGGGGGGSGAPANAHYLLVDASVDLPNAVVINELPSEYFFLRDYGSGTGGVGTTIGTGIRTTGVLANGSQIEFPFLAMDNTGNDRWGKLGFTKLVGAASKLEINGYANDPIAELTNSTDGDGLEFTFPFAAAVKSDYGLILGTTSAEPVVIAVNNAQQLRFTAGEMSIAPDYSIRPTNSLQVYLASGKLFKVWNAANDGRFSVEDDGVHIYASNRDWTWNSSNGNLNANGGGIYGLGYGTGSGGAMTHDQFYSHTFSFAPGENTKTLAIPAIFDSMVVHCAFVDLPSGPVAFTPIALVGRVSGGGNLTVWVVDLTTGFELIGGVVTAVDIAVSITYK